jgi:hypothetical protein
VGAGPDPGAEMALTMAEEVAAQGDFAEALYWLEVAGERAPLDPAYAAKRREWIRQVRRGTGDTSPRGHARNVRPELPSS